MTTLLSPTQAAANVNVPKASSVTSVSNTLNEGTPTAGRSGFSVRSIVNVRILGLIASIAVGLAIFMNVAPENGLTETGVAALAVTVGGIILWLTNGLNWTSLVVIGMFVLSGASPNSGAGNPWAASLGNPIVSLVIAWLLLANVLDSTGVIDNIVAWAISRPYLQGRPRAFLAVFFGSHALLGIVMQNLAIGVIYLRLTEAICKRLNLQKGDKLYTALMSGTNWANSVTLVGSPIAKTWPLVMIGFLAAQGITIPLTAWLAVGIPFTLAVIAIILICLTVYNPDLTPIKDLDVTEFRRGTPPITKGGKIASVAMVALIAFVVIPELVLAFGPQIAIAQWITSLGLAVPAIIVVAILCLVRVEGKPVMDFTDALHKVEWGVVLFIGATMLVAGAFSNPANGLQEWMGYFFAPIFGGMSPMTIITVAVVCVIIVSQFMANGLTMTVFWTIGSPLLIAQTGTTHLAAFGLAICMAAGMAVLTGPASLMPALLFEPGHLTIKNSYKQNLLFMALAVVAVLFLVVPLINLVVGAS